MSEGGAAVRKPTSRRPEHAARLTAAQQRVAHQPVRKRLPALLVAGLAISVLLAALAVRSPAAAAGDDGLEVIGTMPALTGNICSKFTGAGKVNVPSLGTQSAGPCPMIADSERNLGFAIGSTTAQIDSSRVTEFFRVYDLARMTVAGEVPCDGRPREGCKFLGLMRGAVDAANGVLYLPQTPYSSGGPSAGIASPLTNSPCEINVFPYANVDMSKPFDAVTRSYAPCPRDRSFTTYAVDLVSEPPGLLLSGTLLAEHAARQPGWTYASDTDLSDFGGENLGQSLFVRHVSVDGEKLAYSWDLDLRGAGCGRRPQMTTFDPFVRPFVAKVGNNLVAYCWDPKPIYWNGGPVGEQGYVVRIPLGPNGRPQAADGSELDLSPGPYVNYRFVRTPALPGYLTVEADPVSGMLLLVTEGPLNGNAVWLFDPTTDRFAGVVTGGFGAQPRNNTMVGVDHERGRVYLLTQDGVLAVAVRQRPLGGGLLYPVAVNEPLAFSEACDDIGQVSGLNCTAGPGTRRRNNWANHRQMTVLPELGRLFLPINLEMADGLPARYLVIQDNQPEAGSLTPPDPDDNTKQIDEKASKTTVNARGEASASGAHAIVAGGVNRTVNQADPACRTDIHAYDDGTGKENSSLIITFELEPQFFANRRCATDQVVTPGHREVFFAKSDAEVGSSSGAVARGAGTSFASADVTSNDVSNVAQCGRGTVANIARFDPGNPDGTEENGFVSGCDQFYDQAAEHGVPDPRGGTRASDGRGFPIPTAICGDFGGAPSGDARGGSSGDLHASTARCDADAVRAEASATTAALVVPDATAPVLSVARTRSLVATAKTAPGGQVTVAFASAEGVRVGPLAIREVKSLAITRARGRADTARVEYLRLWCGISVVSADETDPRTFTGEGDCVDPDRDQATQNLIASFNQASPKARLSLPPPNGPDRRGDATDGGFQAVLIKDPDARAGDRSVNDDDSHDVAGLEVVIYNDGPGGRNRYIVQLAGVHAESRYGVVELPDLGGTFDPPDHDDGAPPPPGNTAQPSGDPAPAGGAQPATGVAVGEPVFGESVTVELLRSNEAQGAPRVLARPQDRSVTERLIRVPIEALRGAIELLVQHPREFALLFLLFSLLGAPLYLGARRRSFARVLAQAS